MSNLIASDKTLSVLIATRGRAGLPATLASILAGGVSSADQVVIVLDGPPETPEATRAVYAFPAQCEAEVKIIERAEAAGHWGHGARNIAMAAGWCTRDFLVNMDDDDTFAPDALSMIRAAVAENPDRPHMFRMNHPLLGVRWKRPELSFGNVGTPMFVPPIAPGKLGEFALANGGDYAFFIDTINRYDNWRDVIVWRKEVIALIRPGGWYG